MAESLKQTVEDKARALAEPLLSAEGLDLLDVEFVREPMGWVLRLFIDRPAALAGEGKGIGVEDCQIASRAVDTALDVEDFIPHEYHLEVSSPGLNRPLKKVEHFRRVEGKKVKVKTYGPLGDPPRKNFSGVLAGVDEESVTVDVEGAGTFRIPYREIAKANLHFEF